MGYKLYMGRKKIILIVGVFTGACLVAFFLWFFYFNGDEYLNRLKVERRYVEAMKEDNFGGKTRQETTDLFIATLKSGDVELASKYFTMDKNLSRERWLKTLSIFKEQGLLDQIAAEIKVESLDFEYNEYSEVWKINNFRGTNE